MKENTEWSMEKVVDGLRMEGLDVEQGLAMTGGTAEGYVEVLEIYCCDVLERLEFLREFEEGVRHSLSDSSVSDNSVPDESALSLFVTQTHALKSASASVGAMEISKSSAALEAAGKNRDMKTVASLLGAFCDALALLVRKIEEAIPTSGRNGN
jgi:HPt (histidine-containing phosphotransfer) domain-containing protein